MRLIFATIASALLLSSVTTAQERVALIIGNAAYQNGNPLKNPTADAADMAATLQSCGFSLINGGPVLDASHEDMDRALAEFRRKAATAKVLLFFFAGHGLEVDGINYLVPTDASLSEKYQVKHRTMALDEILGAMAENDTLKIVILDCCRDNPLGRGWNRSGSQGLAAPQSTPNGTILLYSAAPGQVASDGNGRNSPFTNVLKREVLQQGLEIEQVFKRVGQSVKAETSVQEPWMNSSFYGSFSFVPGEKNSPMVSPVTPKPAPAKPLTPQEELITFIKQYYTVGDIGTGEAAAGFFSPVVGSYYGKTNLTREAIQADQKSYGERWPNRKFTLIGEPVITSGASPESFLIITNYSYELSDPSRAKDAKGTGSSVFTIRKTEAGWKIFGVEENSNPDP